MTKTLRQRVARVIYDTYRQPVSDQADAIIAAFSLDRVAEIEAALGRLLAALTDEESEHGFPFNFEARDALAAALRAYEKGKGLNDG